MDKKPMQLNSKKFNENITKTFLIENIKFIKWFRITRDLYRPFIKIFTNKNIMRLDIIEFLWNTLMVKICFKFETLLKTIAKYSCI